MPEQITLYTAKVLYLCMGFMGVMCVAEEIPLIRFAPGPTGYAFAFWELDRLVNEPLTKTQHHRPSSRSKNPSSLTNAMK